MPRLFPGSTRRSRALTPPSGARGSSRQKSLPPWIVPAVLCCLILAGKATAQLYTTYHWHLQQPIYWPDRSQLETQTYEKAWESIQNRNGGAPHPENDVEQIFSVADRQAAYQWRVRDAIAGMSGWDSGAQVSYGGCLAENVRSLGEHGCCGYGSDWYQPNRTARGWTTSGGRPRLDLVLFSYHHALCPLIDENALRMEIRIMKEIHPELWSSQPGISTGFFPPELAFSERMIKVLVEEGIEWCFVPNNHVSRACGNFPLVLGTGGENCAPPNPADQVNPAQANWFSRTISRGCTPTNAYPYAYTPHAARYVDPDTGQDYRLVVVPVAQAMSWEDGYQMYGLDDIDQIAWASDPTQPMLIVLAHDGDNAWGGGYSYYMESVPNFTSQAVAAGYTPSVVQEYLQDHPVDLNDLVHVEDGAWVNADNDFGSPDFINWNWPLVGPGGDFDIAGGWAEDERNWAVITAAQNRVETAEQIAGGVDPASVQDPVTHGANDAELAWHFFLPSLTSGYMYYGTALDMEVKPTVACNQAVGHADAVIGDGGSDQTPPSIWIPQQLPHNPGGTGYGPLWGYQQVTHARDFWIWTFVYDVSGLDQVTWYYRMDGDGVNPLASSQNETYAGGPEVGAWTGLSMNQRAFPTGNFYNDPNIDFFVLPDYIADEYYLHVQEPALVDSGGVLIDYYVEAVDNLGYTKRSPIQHTWIDTGGGGGPGDDTVVWSPEEPEAGGELSIGYDLSQGALPPGSDPVFIHIGHSGWTDILDPDPEMSYNPGTERWEYTYQIPAWATSVDFVFNDGLGNWDNNSGQDWHVPVSGAVPPYVMDGQLEDSAQLVAEHGGLSLWADWNGSELYLASNQAQGTGRDHFIFLASGAAPQQGAPWAKSGQVMQWEAFIGNEADNGWAGWFDLGGATPSQSASGTVVEGILGLEQELGDTPDAVWLALGAWDTPAGGWLQEQAPASNDGNSHIELDEFASFSLGLPQPAAVTGLELTILPEGSALLSWVPVTSDTLGQPLEPDFYNVYFAEDQVFDPESYSLLAATPDTSYVDPLVVGAGSRRFYKVRAVAE